VLTKLTSEVLNLPFSFINIIPIIELYTLEGTCYYHEGMEYCPVLLKMGPQVKQNIREFYPDVDTENDYKYILQVWNSKSEKIYEKMLISKVSPTLLTNL
jgi:hypothetical protein